ncbi:MAG: glycosyltransferase [Bacteroidota bacterium]
MKILYLSYWGANEGISSSTVLPHLHILAENALVESILFCSVERADWSEVKIPKVAHRPLISKTRANVFFTKINDFIKFPCIISQLCKQNKIQLIIARSPLAGAIGFMAAKMHRIPFVVESFEPHGISMVESGVWSRWDPRYLIERWFENQQKRKADFIVTVSSHYLKKLEREGVERQRLWCVPCCVSLKDFAFDGTVRSLMRRALEISADTVAGIYVGKFGGIYYDEDAFALYAGAFSHFRNFHLIILTGDDHSFVTARLKKAGIDLRRVTLRSVPHHEVPKYLSAADFAFSTIKPVPSRLFCSPIKNGEYWANGLPILLEPGIGDDSDIIKTEGGGVLLHRNDIKNSFKELSVLLKNGRERNVATISRLAAKYRDMTLVKNGYDLLLNKISSSSGV